LFLRPSTFVVADRVTTTAGVQKIFTLNVPGAPTQGAGAYSVTNNGNQLDVYSLAPANRPSNFVVNKFRANDVAGRVETMDDPANASSFFLNVMGTNGSVSSAVRNDADGQTGADIVLADGRKATVRFGNGSIGGSLSI